METPTQMINPAVPLWRDRRPFKARLLLTLPVTLSCAFTFVLFGMLDLYLQNHVLLPFLLEEIFWPVVLLSLGMFAGLAALLLLLRGRVLDVALSLLLGVLWAGYLQGTFLNLPLGSLDGTPVAWAAYRGHAVANLILWAGLIALPFALHALWPAVWQRLVLIVPLLLVGMQLAGLIATWATTEDLRHHHDRYLSEAGIYEVSTQDNILVFIVDRLDGRFIDQIMNGEEDFFDVLDGFTYYRDNTSLYARTYPSIPYMLTGHLGLFDSSAKEFCDRAFHEAQFLPTLRQAGYTTKLYIQQGYAYTDLEQLEGLADNILSGDIRPDIPRVLEQMGLLAAYRYVPHALKASFRLSSDAVEGLTQPPVGQAPYAAEDYKFYQKLLQGGLTTQTKQKNFAFIHLHGSHYPFVLDENARQIPWEEGNELPQTKGCFKIIYEYLNQMRQLGLYENATIIITGDHGAVLNQPLEDSVTAALFYKPKGSADKPLASSFAPTSHANFQPTIIAAAGLEATAFGRTLAEVPEDDEESIRVFYNWVDGPPARLEHFIIHGYAEDFDNWEKVEEIPAKYPHGS